MFDTLIVQPIFNLLVFIYGLLPGHDFGIAIIIFTIVVRVLMWPLMRKQLHNTRIMRAMQPDIKKINQKYKADKQKKAEMMMELYKERGVSPFSSIGMILIQLPILFGLFGAIKRLIEDTNQINEFTYGFIRDLPFIQKIAENHELFDKHFLGVIDLSRQAYQDGAIYIPLMIMALTAGLLQYYQTRQMSPDSGDRKSLRDILKASAEGKEADQSEINAAMGRNMQVLFPLMTIVFAATFPGSLALYWVAGSAIALVQNRIVLGGDVKEMEQIADNKPASDSSTPEATSQKNEKSTTKKSDKASKKHTRRDRKKQKSSSTKPQAEA